MPQGKRTVAQEAAFSRMLNNINLLFLGASIFILLDMSYSSRFWTQVPPHRSKSLRGVNIMYDAWP